MLFLAGYLKHWEMRPDIKKKNIFFISYVASSIKDRSAHTVAFTIFLRSAKVFEGANVKHMLAKQQIFFF